MTREEREKAIQELEDGRDGYSEYISTETFNRAIEALKRELSADCISRSEIIDELNRLGRNAFKDDTDYDSFFAFVDSLHPVTPKRSKGEWTYSYKDDTGACSCCGYEHYLGTYRQYSTNFCPNCGADMRGGKE